MNVTPELDIVDARRRLLETADEAKRLEDAGDGWAANEAWEKYLTIEGAIAAHERLERIAMRMAG
jgi:hypothetical protein